MLFLKEHLAGQYTWHSESQNLLYKGTPTRRIFDRFNGNQVLFMINCLGASSAMFSIEEGKEIEKLIAHQLPLDTQSELSVFNWLKSKTK